MPTRISIRIGVSQVILPSFRGRLPGRDRRCLCQVEAGRDGSRTIDGLMQDRYGIDHDLAALMDTEGPAAPSGAPVIDDDTLKAGILGQGDGTAGPEEQRHPSPCQQPAPEGFPGACRRDPRPPAPPSDPDV